MYQSVSYLTVLQCFTKIRDKEAHHHPSLRMVAGGSSGRCQSSQSGITWPCGLALSVGVSIPFEPSAFVDRSIRHAKEQHQLPGDLHDQCRFVLCGTLDFWCNGNVSTGPAAVPAWQGLPLYLWLLGCLCDVSAHGDSYSGARMANLLQQEATGRVVQFNTREEEEINMLLKEDLIYTSASLILYTVHCMRIFIYKLNICNPTKHTLTHVRIYFYVFECSCPLNIIFFQMIFLTYYLTFK